jgi:pimeloyl-ACP methyl ester carboxylesterase
MTEQVNMAWGGKTIAIETAWINTHLTEAPLLVFLHEGLGSVAMWRDFPQCLCNALGYRGLVYSRPGYGQSTSRAKDDQWGLDFMHRQAYEVLPALLLALHVDAKAQPVRLFGHSDGASIALLFAARFPEQVQAVAVMAPHIFVEPVSVSSIEAAREAYLHTDLKSRLARYHANVDSAFWGWNDIWLRPEFVHWNITQDLGTIRCSVLALQGLDDEYGTLDQIDGIVRQVPQTQLLKLAQCGHSPHRDQPEQVLKACTDFFHKGDSK